MNVIIIGNKKDTDLINLTNLKKNYPDVGFIISEDTLENTDKNNLIIIMKELESYDIKGKKSLFLETEIDHPKNFFLVSFDTVDVNVNKIKLLIDIFLS